MRYTVPKNLWSKLRNRMEKKNDHALRACLERTKTTLSPKGDAIFWDPDQETLGLVLDHLTDERTYVKRRSGTIMTYDQEIARLRILTGREKTPDLYATKTAEDVVLERMPSD